MKNLTFTLMAIALVTWMAGSLLSQNSSIIGLKIDGYGKVRQFPDAKDQPRDGASIVVDLTAGGDRDKLNPGIEKLARYVNIYAAAGKRPSFAQISVVLHGEATLVALNHESYKAAFQVEKNPNLELMKTLKAAGVEFVVCGQSLTSKGHEPEQVTPEVGLAVSGLTALVNRQQDGYAYVPVAK